MFDFHLDFDRPAWLLLLVLLPLFFLIAQQSLAAVGRWRRVLALLLRGLVAVGLIAALAEVHIVHQHDRLAVMYLVDRSLSVSPDQARAAITYINQSRAEQRDRQRGDLAGVVVFGRESAIEFPPLDSDLPLGQIEASIDAEATNIASALRLARACFPPDCSKRIVVISDGNENLESALQEAGAAADADIGIDVVPLHRSKAGDVAIDKIAIPAEVRRGAPFDVHIVLNNSRGDAPGPGGKQPESAADGPSEKGRLQVVRRVGNQEELLMEQPVTVEPGKHVFSFRQEIEAPDFYTYEARFLPDQPGHDAFPQNNQASAFAQVLGSGRALLIEDWSHPGEFQHLVDRLRASRLEVDVLPSNHLFADLNELQRYDTVVLANVPRTSGDDAEVSLFSDDQLDMLLRNTQQLGSGLVMLGGPNSFGAGGWANTPLEKAMPVDFQINNDKVVPLGALMLVIDRSGSMIGEKLEMSKAAAIAALKVLGERDQIGVVVFDSAAEWIIPLQQVGRGGGLVQKISRIGPGGGTNMEPGMREGYRALGRIKSAVKHLIVLTDGMTEGAGYQQLAAQMRKQGITTTSVAVGSDAADALMRDIASAGGGKYYHVEKPSAIPRIFMKEARRVARPLLYEKPEGIAPHVEFPHEMLAGIQTPPPMTGFVMTRLKASPLVELALASPQPAPKTHPLLASWTFGLGRAVALTTDAGQRWTKAWADWEGYDKLFTQIVRWSMRPTTGSDNFTLAADVREGTLHVVVNALDKDQAFLNFLPMQGTLVDPRRQVVDLSMEQTAPGRYVGRAAASTPGSYFITVVPGPGQAPLRAGITVPYSAEFHDVDSNSPLLAELAAVVPKHGTAGQVIDAIAPSGQGTPGLTLVSTAINVFRRDLPRVDSRQPCWHWLALAAACLLLVDIVNRRVTVTYADIAPVLARAIAWLPGWRRELKPAPEVMSRLRQRKLEVGEQLDVRRAGIRLEPTSVFQGELEAAASGEPEASAPGTAPQSRFESAADTLTGADDDLRQVRPQAPQSLAPQAEADADSYTSRLLKAKRKVWEER